MPGTSASYDVTHEEAEVGAPQLHCSPLVVAVANPSGARWGIPKIRRLTTSELLTWKRPLTSGPK